MSFQKLRKKTIVSDPKFTYYRYDGYHSVSGKPVDFLKAIDELMSLDWNYTTNYFGIDNHKTGQTIQFVRLEKDKWYVEVLLKVKGKWTGYVIWCYSDYEQIEFMLDLFFLELGWDDVMTWEFKEVKKIGKK